MGKFSEGFKVFVRAKNSDFSSEQVQEYWRGFLREKLRASMGGVLEEPRNNGDVETLKDENDGK